jgi:hypothetical protein
MAFAFACASLTSTRTGGGGGAISVADLEGGKGPSLSALAEVESRGADDGGAGADMAIRRA